MVNGRGRSSSNGRRSAKGIADVFCFETHCSSKPGSIETSHHLIFGHGREVIKIDSVGAKLLARMGRDQDVVLLGGDRELW